MAHVMSNAGGSPKLCAHGIQNSRWPTNVHGNTYGACGLGEPEAGTMGVRVVESENLRAELDELETERC